MQPAPGSRAIITSEKLSQIQASEDSLIGVHLDGKSRGSPTDAVTEPNEGQFSLLFPFHFIL